VAPGVCVRVANALDLQTDLTVLIHDAFKPLDYWKDFMAEGAPTRTGVAMDVHKYQVFTSDEVSRTEDQHINATCQLGSSLSSFHLPVIVGEWSAAYTDCAKYLNGRGRGSRYDGTFDTTTKAIGTCENKSGSGENFSEEYKTFLRKYWEAQVITWEKGAGWVHWTWKTQEADDWSYQAGLEGGWIPQDPTEREFPTVCG